METSPVVSTPPGRSLMYYIDDGVYGSLNCILFDHCQAMPKVLGVDGRVLAEDEEVRPHRHTHRHSGVAENSSALRRNCGD